MLFGPTHCDVHPLKDYLINNALKIYSLNHSKKNFHNPLEEVDLEEKKAIFQDLLNSCPVQGKVELVGHKLEECRAMFGGPQTKEICGFDCTKWNVNLDFEYLLNKKNVFTILPDVDKYLDPEADIIADTGPEQVQKLRFRVHDKDIVLSTKEKKEKCQSINLFLAEKHPFAFSDILPVLRALSSGNPLLEKLDKIVSQPVVLKVMEKGFPVRMQIPLSMSIRANLTFKVFKKLNAKDVPRDHFDIPSEYKLEARKVAQKILTHPKKRMLLANLLV